jgi:hypothetical protein
MKEFLAILVVVLIVGGLLVINEATKDPVKQWTGTIIKVSNWDGVGFMQTKTSDGKDTVIQVRYPKHSRFVVGQVLTAWTGGNSRGEKATTIPQ